jgi:hypothetical protein
VPLWNWKSAALSAALRTPLYVVAALNSGFIAAARAGLTDALLRLILSGAAGALTQRVAAMRAGWQSTTLAFAGVLLLMHALEALVHWRAGSAQWTSAFRVSLVFSAVSVLFNLYAMRRGALIAGAAGRPLKDDLRRLPGLIAGFLRNPFSGT